MAATLGQRWRGKNASSVSFCTRTISFSSSVKPGAFHESLLMYRKWEKMKMSLRMATDEIVGLARLLDKEIKVLKSWFSGENVSSGSLKRWRAKARFAATRRVKSMTIDHRKSNRSIDANRWDWSVDIDWHRPIDYQSIITRTCTLIVSIVIDYRLSIKLVRKPDKQMEHTSPSSIGHRFSYQSINWYRQLQYRFHDFMPGRF